MYCLITANFKVLFSLQQDVPTRKYIEPQTSNQEYGWITQPLVCRYFPCYIYINRSSYVPRIKQAFAIFYHTLNISLLSKPFFSSLNFFVLNVVITHVLTYAVLQLPLDRADRRLYHPIEMSNVTKAKELEWAHQTKLASGAAEAGKTGKREVSSSRAK